MFIKVVYSFLSNTIISHRSLTNGPYSLVYQPGEWVEPILEGSRLFVYDTPRSAVASHRRRTIRELPYMGITFWTVEVIDARKIEIIKDPPAQYMELFWKMYNSFQRVSQDRYNRIPYLYKFRDIPIGVYAAKKVRLLNMLTDEDFRPGQ